jgi:hypothetical protein
MGFVAFGRESVMSKSEQASLETDPRFPSGPWTGFFLQPLIPGRHLMELHLTFCQYEIKGEGRDWVGKFVIRGKYTLPDGRCHWTKRYIGKHDVFYQGFNEGKGIWGKWEILPDHGQVYQHGGFHIWPDGMPDPTGSYLTEAAEEPILMAETIENAEPVAEPVGADLPSRNRLAARNGSAFAGWKSWPLGSFRKRPGRVTYGKKT